MNAVSALSRRAVLQAGGVLVVGFSLTANGAQAAEPEPRSAKDRIDRKMFDAWLTVHEDNTATVYVGKVELGQGTTTGLVQIAAEELDLMLSQVKLAPVDTWRSVNQGDNGRSSGIEEGGSQLRQAAAEARLALLMLAAKRLDAPVEALEVDRGVVSVRGKPLKAVSYGRLVAGRRLDVPFTGTAKPKPVSEYRIVGTRTARIDFADKLTGRYLFMQQVAVPGMVHGRVVRPSGQTAYGDVPKIVSVDEGSIAGIPGVRVIRKGNFLGVVAPDEWDAVRASRALKVEWSLPPRLGGSDKLYEKMRAGATEDTVIVGEGDIERGLADAAHVAHASFAAPYQSHSPFAACCSIADVQADHATVWSPTQHPFDTPNFVAKVIGMKPDQVRVLRHEGSGGFGRSNFDDASQAAAILSQAVGKPVRVQFSRSDETGWDQYGNAHVSEVRAGCDAQGKLTAYDYQGWHTGWSDIEASDEMANAVQPAKPGSGPARQVNKFNVGAMYDLPNKRLLNHHLNMLDGYVRSSALRSPLDLALTFSSEQIIDELAFMAGLDPIEFRRRNISNHRWMGVLDAVAEASNWQPKVAASARGAGPLVTGRGVALGTHFVSYGAAVAEVEVNLQTGLVRVTHVWPALDAGLAINPALIENQLMGMSTQATSRLLKEEVRFDDRAVTSKDWVSYPVLRFGEYPEVTPTVVQRLNEKSTGAGEEAMGAVAGAIANAVFDAAGVRMRRYPMTPERVLAALKTADAGHAPQNLAHQDEGGPFVHPL